MPALSLKINPEMNVTRKCETCSCIFLFARYFVFLVVVVAKLLIYFQKVSDEKFPTKTFSTKSLRKKFSNYKKCCTINCLSRIMQRSVTRKIDIARIKPNTMPIAFCFVHVKQLPKNAR